MRRVLRRRGDDRGVAIVEAAIISPVFLVLLFGVFEFGLVFRDYLTVGDATADAVRIGGIQGNKVIDGETADFSVVNAVRQATGGIDPETIDEIVVFKALPSSAGNPLEQVPPQCKNAGASVSGVCNVYDPRDAFLAIQNGDVSPFICDGGSEPACGWDPTSRNDGPDPMDIDYLGIYIKMERPWVTGIFGETFTLEDASITRLEPGPVEG